MVVIDINVFWLLIKIVVAWFIIKCIIYLVKVVLDVIKNAEEVNQLRELSIRNHYLLHTSKYNSIINFQYDYVTLLKIVEKKHPLKDISNYFSKLSEDEINKLTEYFKVPWIKGYKKNYLFHRLEKDLYSSYDNSEKSEFEKMDIFY